MCLRGVVWGVPNSVAMMPADARLLARLLPPMMMRTVLLGVVWVLAARRMEVLFLAVWVIWLASVSAGLACCGSLRILWGYRVGFIGGRGVVVWGG